MKRKRSIQLQLLVLIHLIVFLFPLGSKLFHVHHDIYGPSHNYAQVSFDHPSDNCPIYHFSYYNFVSEDPIVIQQFAKTIHSFRLPEHESRSIPHTGYVLLRAPPIV